MSTLKILVDNEVVHQFVYDELEYTVRAAELTLKATRGPTGTVRDGLLNLAESICNLPTGTILKSFTG